MAQLIGSEQQFTCSFKSILVCNATVTAPKEKSPDCWQRKPFILQEKQSVDEPEPNSGAGEFFFLSFTY